MSTLKTLFFYLTAILITIFLIVSCTENKHGPATNPPQYIYPDVDTPVDVLLDISKEDASGGDVEVSEPDTYEQDCIKCDYYFCPPLDEIWQKEICIDHCTDPPSVVLEGKCEELLECAPTNHIIEKDIPCVTDEGYPGFKDKTCDK